MTILAVVLSVLCGLVTLVWTSRHIMIQVEKRKDLCLSENSPGVQAPAPRISVFVAAKDEEAVIERCVHTMLDQDYPNYELVVCNDRSSDATAEIVQRVAQEDSRLRLFNIQNLPEGWCGKNNAMQTGIATSDSEWICMIDADCWQTSRTTLSKAMRYAQDTQADLLSVLPNLDMQGFWENVVQPVCSGVMIIWFPPDKVNSPNKPNAYANGAFMLIRRSAYEKIGTHEAVKHQVNEDMHMADLIKKAGLTLKVIRNEGLYRVRMYTSFKQIIRGWSRIFFGTFGTLPRLMASLMVLAVMGLLPYLSAILGLTRWDAGTGWKVCGLLGLTAALMQVSVIFRFYKLIGARKWLAWTYPIGCGVAIVTVFNALGKLRKGAKVTWRGTSYTRKP